MPRGRTKKTVNEPNINWTKHSRNTRHRKREMEKLEKDIKNLMGEFDIIKPKRPRSSGKRPSGKRPSGKRPSGTRNKRVDPRHKRFKPRVAGNPREFLFIDIPNEDIINKKTISPLKSGTIGEGEIFLKTPDFGKIEPTRRSATRRSATRRSATRRSATRRSATRRSATRRNLPIKRNRKKRRKRIKKKTIESV